MLELKMYAIRHDPTGHFIPNPRGRDGRGGSHQVPCPAAPLNPPRLFTEERHAKIALTVWLQGRRVTRYSEYNEACAFSHIEPVPTRKREEMSIVELVLAEADILEKLRSCLADTRDEICSGPLDDVLWHHGEPGVTTVDNICHALGDDWTYDEWVSSRTAGDE